MGTIRLSPDAVGNNMCQKAAQLFTLCTELISKLPLQAMVLQDGLIGLVHLDVVVCMTEPNGARKYNSLQLYEVSFGIGIVSP